MSRLTLNFSIYSVMSMRIMFFSLSNRAWASAFASSVLPTPVGPRNKKLPMGRPGFAMPARLRRMASHTFCTASCCPMTRWCRMPSRPSSFSRSPSTSFSTGMPVQRATMRAISSSVTRSRRRLSCAEPEVSALCSCSASCFCSSGRRPYFSSAALLRSYSRSAFSMAALVCSICSRMDCRLPMLLFSLSHRAFMALYCSRISASSF